jgi:hypoxanthine phosphoribosyltransferase
MAQETLERHATAIDGVHSVAMRLYPPLDGEHLYEGVPMPPPFRSAVSDPTCLSAEDVTAAAARLPALLTGGSDGFLPELLVALNEGGMVACGLLRERLAAHVGVAFTSLDVSPRTNEFRAVEFFALPQTPASRAARFRRVLVVDTKLKTGDSAANAITVLRQRLKTSEIRLAVLMAYGPWDSSRWTFRGPHWPVTFRHPRGDMKTYVVYHYDYPADIRQDPVREAWRRDIVVSRPQLPAMGTETQI